MDCAVIQHTTLIAPSAKADHWFLRNLMSVLRSKRGLRPAMQVAEPQVLGPRPRQPKLEEQTQ